MRSTAAALLTAALLLALPGSAFGAVELGSAGLGSSADVTLGCTSGACIQVQEQTDGDFGVNEVPSGGRIITGFSVRYAAGNVALTVLRQSGSSLSRVAGTNFISGAGADVVQSFTTHVAVQPGDFIGLRLASGASLGALNGGPETNAFELSDVVSPSIIDPAEPYELQLSAIVEADRDNDGRADDSEDPDGGFPATLQPKPQPKPPSPDPKPDPLAELRAGKRPRVSISRSRLTATRGVVSLKVANKNGYRVSGRIKLRRRGRTVGSRRYSLGAGRTGRVRIRLNRATRRALRRKRRLRLGVVASVKGPIGKTGTSRRTVTVVLPRKKRKRRSSGGSDRFVGRANNTNVEFSFRLVGNQLRDVKGALRVTCYYPGTSKSETDVFNPAGPFRLGGEQEQFRGGQPSGITGSTHNKRYTLSARKTSSNRVSGTIGIFFTTTGYNPTTGFFQGVSCFGKDGFTATRR